MADNPLISMTIALRDLASAGLKTTAAALDNTRDSLKKFGETSKASAATSTAFSAGLANLRTQATEIGASLKTLGSSLAASSLTLATDTLSNFVGILGTARSVLATAGTAFSVLGTSLSSMATSSVAAARGFGQSLLPVLTQVNSGFKAIGQVIGIVGSGFFTSLKESAISAGGALAKLLIPVTAFAGPIGSAMAGEVMLAGKALGVLETTAAGAATATAGLVNTVGSGLRTAFAGTTAAIREALAFLAPVGAILAGGLSAGVRGLSFLVSGLSTSFISLGAEIAEFSVIAGGVLLTAVRAAATAFAALGTALLPIISVAGSFILGSLQKVGAAIASLVSVVASAAATVLSSIQAILSAAGAAALTVGSVLVTAVSGGLALIASLVVGFGTILFKSVGSILQGATNLVKNGLKGIIDALLSWKALVIGILATLGITKLAEDFIHVEEELDKIGKTALRLGFTGKGAKEDFQALVAVADQLNISLEVLDGSFRVFQRNLSKAARGAGTESRVVFQKLGIDYKQLARDVDNGTKTIFDALLVVSEALKGLNLPTKDFVSILFGETSPRFLSLIDQGKDALKDLLDAAKAAGLTVNDTVFEGAFRVVEQYKTLKQVIFTTKAVIFDALSAPILEIFNSVTKFLVTLRFAKDEIKDFFAQGTAGWKEYKRLIDDATHGFSTYIKMQGLSEARVGNLARDYVALVDEIVQGNKEIGGSQDKLADAIDARIAGLKDLAAVSMQAFEEARVLGEASTDNAVRIAQINKQTAAEAAANVANQKAAILQAGRDLGLVYDANEQKALTAYGKLRFLVNSILGFLKETAVAFGKFLFEVLYSVVVNVGEALAAVIINKLRGAGGIFAFLKEQTVKDAGEVSANVATEVGAAASKMSESVSKAFGGLKENVLAVLPGLQGAGDRAKVAVDRLQELVKLLTKIKDEAKEAKDDLAIFFSSLGIEFSEVILKLADFEDAGKKVGKVIGEALTSGITGTLRDIILNSADAAVAFRKFASSMLADIAEIIAQFLLAILFKRILEGSSGGTGGAIVAVAGAAGFAEGGEVPGNPSVRRDVVPAMLSPREFVQPRDTVDYYGADFMESLRQRKFPRSMTQGYGLSPYTPKHAAFADGGLASVAQRTSTAPSPSTQILALDAKFMRDLLNSPAGPVLDAYLKSRERVNRR